ncbi:FadR/GntR family transcriptional regulator [Micromonosporaceae bacterium Da 78-11]
MASYSGRGLHGQTVEAIARRIVSGQIAEGDTLDITHLQQELDVSLTAVREALRVLAAKGLVDARQKRGTFVRAREHWNLLDADLIRWQFSDRVDPDFLEHLAEIREIIEPAAARLAARRRTPEDLDALQAALDAMVDAEGDPAAEVEADLGFHRALLAATHNELLERMEMILTPGLAARDRLVHSAADGRDDPVPSHRGVLAAIRAGDTAQAEDATTALLVKAASDLDRIRKTVG